ncbi:MAG: hypothetical protein Roseis2KO_59690 [Roseivirga sp.]
MRKFFILSLAVLLFQATGMAQSTFGFSLEGFAPTGDFKRDSPELWGGGFGMEVAIQLNNSPVHVGGQFNFLRYGSELRNGWHGPNLGDVRVRRNNEIFNTLAFVRLKPEVKGRVQPYVDFLAGFNYIYTRANFRDSALEEEFFQEKDLGDFSLSYGVGGGFEIFLDEEVSLDFRVKTLRGTQADYLTSRSVTYNSEFEAYDLNIKNAKLDYFTFSIGIKVLLSSLD